jgi:hypothetical protein
MGSSGLAAYSFVYPLHSLIHPQQRFLKIEKIVMTHKSWPFFFVDVKQQKSHA